MILFNLLISVINAEEYYMQHVNSHLYLNASRKRLHMGHFPAKIDVIKNENDLFKYLKIHNSYLTIKNNRMYFGNKYKFEVVLYDPRKNSYVIRYKNGCLNTKMQIGQCRKSEKLFEFNLIKAGHKNTKSHNRKFKDSEESEKKQVRRSDHFVREKVIHSPNYKNNQRNSFRTDSTEEYSDFKTQRNRHNLYNLKRSPDDCSQSEERNDDSCDDIESDL